MQTVLIVIHLIVVSALAVVVLLQRSEGGGLGLGGGGGPTGLFTGRGQANLLTRTTAILGAVFFATSLALSILAARSTGTGSPLDQIIPNRSEQPAAPSPAAPAQPSQGQGVLDQLRGLSQQNRSAVPAIPAPATSTPAAPAPAAPAPAAPAPEAPKQ